MGKNYYFIRKAYTYLKEIQHIIENLICIYWINYLENLDCFKIHLILQILHNNTNITNRLKEEIELAGRKLEHEHLYKK